MSNGPTASNLGDRCRRRQSDSDEFIVVKTKQGKVLVVSERWDVVVVEGQVWSVLTWLNIYLCACVQNTV